MKHTTNSKGPEVGPRAKGTYCNMCGADRPGSGLKLAEDLDGNRETLCRECRQGIVELRDSDILIPEAQKDALGVVLDLAFEDQQSYLGTGSPKLDYGKELPEVAELKRKTFLQVAKLAERVGLIGEWERWTGLADSWEELAEHEEAAK